MQIGIFLFNKKGESNMKYKYGVRRRASEYEKALVEFWKKNKTFEKSVENCPIDNSYVFYDGPPFITGMPHHGTLLSSVVKDAVPRYWTMNGKRVERRWGWDCHGLPAENFVEKQLGITDRRDIGTKISLEDYIIKARESMVANSETWRGTIDRIGRWVDFDNCYRTMNKDFMESVWWAFKTLYEKGKIYEGAKVLMYDTKFATPVSKAEVTMDNDAYQTVTDPSAYVKFMINDGELKGVYLMAWTTTPWTLFGNMALAVNKKLTYALYQDGEGRKFIALKGKAQGDDWKELDAFKGEKLVGLSYEPLFLGETNTPLVEWQKFTKDYYEAEEKNAHKVYAGDFVGSEEGTGIVHIAPAYGEDDFALCKKEKVPIIDVLDDNGFYLDGADIAMKEAGVRPDEDGKIHAWDMNKIIAKCFEGDDKPIYKIEYIQHEYPFNPRSKQRIMYRAIPSWFFDIEGNKSLMLEKNEGINWFPEHLKHGRFAKNIEQAPDWNLSRDRFWATAMPVWKSDKGTIKVVGSYDELYELSGKRLEDYHRPWIDEIEFDIDGEHFKRVDKVLDCWFESGSMPFAQLHYPFENKEKFEKNYPADFIVEYVGQVRAWFYYVHAVNTALFGDKAYKNVITTGTLAGNDGRKMSKSLGNYTDPNELMDKYSADALRFLMLSSPVLAGEDFALIDKDVSDTARKLTMVWNVYDFFTMYAEVDGWEYKGDKLEAPAKLENPLDAWIVSRLYQLRDEVTDGMERYNLPAATAGILPFIDDLSNWFVRRSRRRFWKSESGEDKAEAYATLHFVLSYLALVMAPFTPFLSEELWQNMTGGESVHLMDWPKAGKVDEGALAKMAECRAVITEGLALRMERNDEYGQIKVRQPLASLTYGGEQLDEFYEQIIAEEVNVKKVAHGKELALDKKLTDELREEGFVRELIRFVQAARKNAALNVDDRIKLSVSCDVPAAYVDTLKNEVLAVELGEGNYAHDEIVKVDGQNVTISLEKA
ncbi:isoleucine--tRNA ligase [Candidatus Saccharibacteria bacterium]|nr:isoleucine--tRNA ligase [Candidatus Saccharibacteria bacterium]